MKFFSLIYSGDVHTKGDEKVIAAEDYSALVSAQEIIDKARADADKLMEETRKKCEELKQEANDKGFDEGLSRFNDHLLAFETNLRAYRHEMQQNLLSLACSAAKKIVAKQLELHPETIVDIVAQAIGPVRQNHRFTIYVNKADRALLEAHKPKLKEMVEQLQTLTIKDREDVAPGGCIIETESGIINATMENQWRALESALAKYLKTK